MAGLVCNTPHGDPEQCINPKKGSEDGDTWEKYRQYNLDGRNVDTSWDETENGVVYAVTATGTGTSGKIRLFVNEYYTTGVVEITSYTSGTQVGATVLD